jgi:hypothetical protein
MISKFHSSVLLSKLLAGCNYTNLMSLFLLSLSVVANKSNTKNNMLETVIRKHTSISKSLFDFHWELANFFNIKSIKQIVYNKNITILFITKKINWAIFKNVRNIILKINLLSPKRRQEVLHSPYRNSVGFTVKTTYLILTLN